MILKLRTLHRWEPFLDRYDPVVIWRREFVLQTQGEDGVWIDVPIEFEGELTDEIKRERLPADQHWRLKHEPG